MIEQLNIQVYSQINSLAGTDVVLDGVAKLFAKYSHVAGIFYLVFAWFRRGFFIKDIIMCAICSVIIGVGINLIISATYQHPMLFLVPHEKMLIPHGPTRSFPSDYTTSILSISLFLIWFKETRTAGVLLTMLGLFGGMARIFCGVHFPLDIIVACGVGLFSAFLTYLLRNWIIHALELFINHESRIYKNRF
ncbi:MAG: hypothetical protein A2076_16645 [Geobacteraceae bacterium GWC2_53_11]|nr:MAG: hypothetical protein A2076_16645 [Geobacteraceae bacterium GWC2_53_11]